MEMPDKPIDGFIDLSKFNIDDLKKKALFVTQKVLSEIIEKNLDPETKKNFKKLLKIYQEELIKISSKK